MQKMVSQQTRREQLALVQTRDLSLRRACGLIRMSRATPSYRPRLASKDAPIPAVMQQLSPQYPRYRYRRMGILLRRQGFELSWSRTHRLWRQRLVCWSRQTAHTSGPLQRQRPHAWSKGNMVWPMILSLIRRLAVNRSSV